MVCMDGIFYDGMYRWYVLIVCACVCVCRGQADVLQDCEEEADGGVLELAIRVHALQLPALGSLWHALRQAP